MVMSELTGGVDGMGLLVFLTSRTYARYADPDQQGDIGRLFIMSVTDLPKGGCHDNWESRMAVERAAALLRRMVIYVPTSSM